MAGEPAVARLAEAQRQLDHFEVVGAGNRPRLGRGVVAQLIGGVQLVVGGGHVQRAVDVAQAGGDGARVVGGLEAGLRGGGVRRVERVAHAKLEAAERRGRVLHHVVVADGVGGAEGHAHVGLAVAAAERIDGCQVLRRDVGLTAEFQQAPRIGLQADGGLAAEQAAALARCAVTRIEAAFQREHGAQAVAQIFGAAQAPTRAARHAVGHADLRFVITVALDALVANTGIDQTVQGHRGFSLGHAGDGGEQRGCEQSLFHYLFLRLNMHARRVCLHRKRRVAHDRDEF
ncbi:hypothetical protein D3C73_856780 [compost metagenome]